MKHIQNIAAILTIITAIVNVIASISLGKLFSSNLIGFSIEVPSLLIRCVIFFYLELTISLLFSYCILHLRIVMGKLPFFWSGVLLPVVLIIPVLSAWTSIFNIEWIFLSYSWDYSMFFSAQTMVIIIFSTLSAAIMFFAGGALPKLTKNNLLIDKYLGHGDGDILNGAAYFSAKVLIFFIIVVLIYKY